MRVRVWRQGALGLICGLLLKHGCGAASAQTGTADWDPRPAADHADNEKTLPLPCGSGLVLRLVPTPVEDSPLADARVTLGDPESSRPFAEFAREVFVVGDFGHGSGAHYWLGKYEVTRGQYTAVMQGCDAYKAMSQQDRRLPQASVTWTDALRFAATATQAVIGLDQAGKALEIVGDARAFIRLPTEAEWEFAERGGHAEQPAFRERLPPMNGPLTQYAQLLRVGRDLPPQPVGALRPDGLGLFDMLGNVSEMVLDPYRLTRGGRSGGRAGGMVIRGGDITMDETEISSAWRTEKPFVLADGSPEAEPTLGFRVALGLPVFTDTRSGTQLVEAWHREAAGTAPPGSAQNAVVMAEHLESHEADAEQKKKIAEVRAAVENEHSLRVQADSRSTRAAIEAGAVLIRSFRNDMRYLQTDRVFLANSRSPSDRLKNEESLRIATHVVETDFAALSSLATRQAELPAPVLADGLAVWRTEMDRPEFGGLRHFAQCFVTEVTIARSIGAVAHDAVFRRLAYDITADPAGPPVDACGPSLR